MPNSTIKDEAKEWLDRLYADLSVDPVYEKSGEEFLARMEWEIRRYTPEYQNAVRAVWGEWLTGNHKGKARTALSLIRRYQAVEYLELLTQLRDELIKGQTNKWPRIWLPMVENVICQLKGGE